MRRPLILIAAMHGNTAEVQRLLEQQQQEPADENDSDNKNNNNNNNNNLDNIINAKDDYGWSPLLLASINGHVQTVRFLLNKGANVNHENVFGNTAIMVAGKRGHFSVVRLLLNHGGASGAHVAYPSISNETLTTVAMEAMQAAAASSKKCKHKMESCYNRKNHGTTTKRPPPPPYQQQQVAAASTTSMLDTLVETMETLILQQNPAMRESLEKKFLLLHNENKLDYMMNVIQTKLLLQKGGLAKSVLIQGEIVSLPKTTTTASPVDQQRRKTAGASNQQQQQQQQQQDTNSSKLNEQEIVHNNPREEAE